MTYRLNINIILILVVSLLFNFNSAANSFYRFIENKGQFNPKSNFVAKIPGGKVYLNQKGFRYNFINHDALHENHHHTSTESVNGHALFVEFLHSNSESKLKGSNEFVTKYNYFRGKDANKWVADAKAFETVNYTSLYDGVDMKLYSTGDNLKYDFVIEPHADASQIEFKYSGADKIELEESGALKIYTSLVEIEEQKPIAYQMVNNQKILVPCEFHLNNNSISFSFPEGYNKNEELVIDPVLIFSTYSGSFSDNWGFTGTYDDQGYAYTGGIEHYFSDAIGGYPTTPGAYQSINEGGDSEVTISKYSPDGSDLIYATYLGGGGNDEPMSIIVNSKNELIILGNTTSSNFPTTFNGYNQFFNNGMSSVSSDIFVTILNANGSNLVSSTYVGGSSNDGRNYLEYLYGDVSRGEVVIDENDNIYVSCNTQSSDFPTVNSFEPQYSGTQDACVFKMNNTASNLLWSGFLGGSGADVGLGLTLDNNNNVYVCGGTEGDFPVTSGAASTTFSGGDNNYGRNNAGSFSADGFLAMISANGSTLNYATYIQSTNTGFDLTYFVKLDIDGFPFVYGVSEGDMQIIGNAYENPNSQNYIQKYTKNLDEILLSTVFGNGRNDGILSPTAFLIDECNRVYISGWGGSTGLSGGNPDFTMNDFPVTSDAFQSTTDDQDFYLAVWDEDVNFLSYGTFFGGVNGRGEHVDGGTSRFSPEGIVYQSVCASCGSQSTPKTSGAYSTYNYSTNCTNAIFKMQFPKSNVKVDISGSDIDTALCINQEFDFKNVSSNANDFTWYIAGLDTINTTSDSTISYAFDQIGNYQITLVGRNDGICFDKRVDTAVFNISVVEGPIAAAGSDTTVEECDRRVKLQGCCGDYKYTWEPSDYLSNPNIQNPIATLDDSITYILTVEDPSGCMDTDTIHIGYNTFEPLVPNIFTPNGDEINELFTIENVACEIGLTIYNRWGREVYHTDNYLNDFDANYLVDGLYYFLISNESITRKGWFQVLR